MTCGPAKMPSTRHTSATWKASPPPPAAARRTRCVTPAARSLTSASSESATLSWHWALAARTAYQVQDTAATRELLALIDSPQPRHLPPMLRAERDLARARLARQDGDPDARAAFGSAVSGLRELSIPYHLAHGLLDYAAYLTRVGDADAAADAIEEAREIAHRLRCRPLLDRADAIEPAQSPVRA